MTEYGRFADEHELLDLLVRRKAELGWSNAKFDKACGFADGQWDKYAGPTRLKSPTLANVEMMLDALGLSGTLYVDETKAESLAQALRREGVRNESWVRPPGRVSKALLRRAAPEVRRVWASLAAHARWKKTTPQQKAEAMRRLDRTNPKKFRARTKR